MKPILLITGGSGFIGEEVVKTLSDDYLIVNLDLRPPKRQSPDYINCDFSDESSIKSALEKVRAKYGVRLEAVIHLAAYYDFQGSESELYEKVNIEGTENFLATLREHFKVSQIIFSSSMLVFTPTPVKTKITEDFPVERSWAYPASKLTAEEILLKWQQDEQLTILRIAAVYNEFGYAPSIGNQIMRIADKHLTTFFFPGNRHHIQSTVHVNDVAEVMRKCLQKRNELPHFAIFSVAENQSPTYDEIQQTVSRLLYHRKIPYLRIPKSLAVFGSHLLNLLPSNEETFIKPWMIKFADANYDLDNSLARKVLDWRPRHSLLKALPQIIRNMKHNPDYWYQINNFHKRVMHEV